ncbi:C39 family peptidase [Castellaniella sp.]|uniref:C39 family peptidase n=1 Tax=Castellaniella sp. TaxID=1955812 RepID=UPI002AFE6005|nr:C39 family peptidase [Castellaniella sp.]
MRAHLLAVTLSICLTGTAHAGSVLVPVLGGVNVPGIESVRERAFSRTVHQQYDFSCGSAAVATLLTYQYNDPVSEQDVFQDMWDHGDQGKIRQEGFSLLDIKRFLDARGYESNGYEVPIDKLVENSVPAIMLISDHGYNHFVVVKGLSKDRVLLGDPSAGARLMSRQDFQKILVTPIVFVITNQHQRALFNGRTDWRTEPLARIGTAMSAARLAQETVFVIPRSDVF